MLIHSSSPAMLDRAVDPQSRSGGFMNNEPTFARRTFLIAAIYGFIVLLPQYFLESRNSKGSPMMENPEYYYGFIGIALAWQVVFFLISRDPVRFRPIMIAAILEKATFGFATVALFILGRLHTEMLVAGLLDLILGVLFTIAWVRTRETRMPLVA
jgi:uncharacterized membrane protein